MLAEKPAEAPPAEEPAAATEEDQSVAAETGPDQATEESQRESATDEPAADDPLAGDEQIPVVAAVVSADFDVEQLIESLADCERPNQVANTLEKSVNSDRQGAGELQAISRSIASSGLAPWLVEESHLWFAEQLFLKDEHDASAMELRAIRVPDEEQASRLLQRIERMFGDLADYPGIAAHCARLSLKVGDHQSALARAALLPAGNEDRVNLLKSIEQWINAQEEIAPDMLFALANGPAHAVR